MRPILHSLLSHPSFDSSRQTLVTVQMTCSYLVTDDTVLVDSARAALTDDEATLVRGGHAGEVGGPGSEHRIALAEAEVVTCADAIERHVLDRMICDFPGARVVCGEVDDVTVVGGGHRPALAVVAGDTAIDVSGGVWTLTDGDGH